MTEMAARGKVAFIGCGHIAHVHLRFLRQAGYRVDAVCDSSALRCELFAQQYGITSWYQDVATMLAQERPQVVHVLTPPHSHRDLALRALEAGCNVLVEKPLCQSLAEYREIMALARARGLLVSVDHTRVYNPMICAARERIKSGELGAVVRMEYAYDDPSLLKGRHPGAEVRWAKGVPAWFSKVRGGVLADLLPHPLSVLLTLDQDLKLGHVQARLLPGGVIEEISLLLSSDSASANVSLSLNQRPLKNVLSVYCEKGSVQIDLRNMYTVYQRDRRLPGVVSRIVVATSTAWQIAAGFSTSVLKMVAGKAHPYDGLDQVFRQFYAQVAAGADGELPLINAAKVMDLTEQILAGALAQGERRDAQEPAAPPALAAPAPAADFLVLGGTGFIGARVVASLVQQGQKARVLARPSSNLKALPPETGVAFGDLRDCAALSAALSGVKGVIHCAAAMSGDWAEFYESTVQGTANLLSCLEGSGVERLVYISSLGVLDYNRLSNGDRVDESAAVEARPADRGFYTRAKVEAERLVEEFASRNPQLTVTILRPGLVYGPQSNNNLQNCGILLDRFLLVFGCGNRQLGLNFVDNLADAVVRAALAPLPKLLHLQVVDEEQPTVRQIIAAHNRLSPEPVTPIYLPVLIWKTAFRLVDLLLYFKAKRLGTFSYRFASNSKRLDYRCDQLVQQLSWHPPYDFSQAQLRTYSGEEK